MAFVGALWSYGIVAVAAFAVGIWIGVRNGKRIAHVDGRFDELVREANLYSRAEVAKNTLR
jgi:hypothetical protein